MRQKSAQVATSTVRHDETKLAAFIMEKVEDWKNVGVVRVCIVDRRRSCMCGAGSARANNRVSIYLDGNHLFGSGAGRSFAFVQTNCAVRPIVDNL